MLRKVGTCSLSIFFQATVAVKIGMNLWQMPTKCNIPTAKSTLPPCTYIPLWSYLTLTAGSSDMSLLKCGYIT